MCSYMLYNNLKPDRRKFNLPPVNESIKRFNTTVSFRIEKQLIDELHDLLNRKYGSQNVPMKKISFVFRTAIKKKINNLNSEFI